MGFISEQKPVLAFKPNKNSLRPIIIGAGPAGLAAAWRLTELGFKPLIIEQGDMAEKRSAEVKNFWQNGALNPKSNVLFGEGGAGLFSDGKLTARSKDKGRIKAFFNILVQCGAPPEIIIEAEPHLGSDVLQRVIINLRRQITKNGGEFFYNTQLTDIFIENGNLTGIKCQNKEIKADKLILAVGHSARDVYKLLYKRGVKLESKPMAVGIRLEMPQTQINLSQYGRFANDARLKPASFKLTRRKAGAIRACYSFCMCPGGLVIACAHENNALTTNGMSYSSRGLFMGNAAFIVPTEPADYLKYANESYHAELSAIAFQEAIEKAAFKAGGGEFYLPALMLNDFLNGKISEALPNNRSCVRSRAAGFEDILPDFVINTLKGSILPMLRQLNAAKAEDAVVYAAETRSSSPVRILRGENGQANVLGIYPAGEGSGYAGGIVSSAVDGLKAAEAICLGSSK